MRRAVVAGVLVSVLGASVAAPAVADPNYPTQQDVRDAHEAETEAGDAVAAVEARLAELTAQVNDLQIQSGKAVEAYNGARLRVAEAEQAEAEARERAATTAAAAEEARIVLGRLAAASYSHGGELSAIGMVLNAEDGKALYDSMGALKSVTKANAGVYQRAADATKAAEEAAVDAEAALAEQQAAATEARDTQAAAESAVAAQEQALGSVEAERDAAMAQLAAARGTTVELELERQQGIAEQQATEREERERQHSSPPPLQDTPVVPPPAAPITTPPPVAPPQTPVVPSPPQPPVTTPTPKPPTPAPEPPAPKPPAPKPPSQSHGAQAAIDYARAQLGKPYVWGADGPGSFDCSGLTMRAWQAGGESIPHWSVAQANATTRVSYSQLQPGDLIFWSDNGKASGVYHVGLYIGGGKMIHAPRPGKTVEIQNVFYWVDPAFYGRV